MTTDEQLKTTFNSTVLAHPMISTHWRKYKHWMRDMVLHGDSNHLKLASEFTAAHQHVSKDPNQFYLQLSNLGIQSDHTISIDDYWTCLVKPLLNLLNQHNRHYPTIQDAVAHAGRLWQTLNPEKVQQEIKEDQERAYHQQHDSVQQADSRPPQKSPDFLQHSETTPSWNPQSQQPWHQHPQHQRPQYQRPQQNQPDARQDNSRDNRLSAEEQQHHLKECLCFNCSHSDYFSDECQFPFNPNCINLQKNESQAKAQTLYTRKWPHSPTRAHSHT
jgi:hypothetical protein